MADDSRSEVSNFLQIEVEHPLTRENIIAAVDKALSSQRVIPTFHTAPSSSSGTDISASASDSAGNGGYGNGDPSKGLLMFVRSQGPGE